MLRKATFGKSLSAHQAVSRKRLVLTSRVGESTSPVKFNGCERKARAVLSGRKRPELAGICMLRKATFGKSLSEQCHQ